MNLMAYKKKLPNLNYKNAMNKLEKEVNGLGGKV